MQSIREASQRDACFPDELGGAAPQDTTEYIVQKGDTLSKLAAGLQRQGLVGSPAEILQRILTLNPQIKDPNRIAKGALLRLPAVTAQASQRQGEPRNNRVEEFVCRAPMSPAYLPPRAAVPKEQGVTAGAFACMGPPTKATRSFLRTNGTPFSTSADGTPQYKQNDVEAGGNWGTRLLGDGATMPATIGSKGCAMTSVAMALSKLSGETITPAVLDGFLDAHEGYVGNGIQWSTAGKVMDPSISVRKTTTWSLDTLNQELDAGRPVVLGVDYRDGASGGKLGTDHWVCLTRRDKESGVYFANDPATGSEITFRRQADGTLLEEALHGNRTQRCRSSGEFVTFRTEVRS